MTGLTNVTVVAIAGGAYYNLVVTSDGRVYGWGWNDFEQLGTNINDVGSINTPIRVAGISNAVLVSASLDDDPGDVGAGHSLAMTVDQGTNHYWGWGDNTYGDLGDGTTGGDGTNGSAVYQYTPAGPVQFCTRCQRCVQLGTGGVFTAQCNGTLYLYFNTDNFGACTGQYNVTFGGLPTNVPANADCGIPVGPVTVGNVYTYTASGYCADPNLDFVDANGINLATGHLMDCSDFSLINITNAVCPMWQCFSLVGRIQ